MEANKRLIRAKSRVEKIKGFYQHLTVYLVINLAFTFISYKFDIIVKIFEGLNITNNLSEIGYEKYPLWILWGIILMIDAFRVFGFKKLLGKDWEKKKLNEFLNENE